MKILDVTTFSEVELLSSLRKVRLRGYDGTEVYRDAFIELVEFAETRLITPAQNYVLRENVDRVGELRTALSAWELDPLALRGGATLHLEDEDAPMVTLVPPIVEESIEPDGSTCLLVSDGLHRLYYAHINGLPLTVAVVRGVSHPYYAFPLPGGWADVALLEALPETHQKKEYREPDNYKALFRDFNGAFPNVQSQRRRSNPPSLTPGSSDDASAPRSRLPDRR